MSMLLEKALEKVAALPWNEQDATASRIHRRWPAKTPGRSALPSSAM